MVADRDRRVAVTLAFDGASESRVGPWWEKKNEIQEAMSAPEIGPQRLALWKLLRPKFSRLTGGTGPTLSR